MLQVLVGDDGVAGFSAGIDAVKKFWLLVEVIAKTLEAFVPIGEFDDELDVGIDGARRLDDEVFRSITRSDVQT